jgi:hypothetical protein
MFSIFTVPEPLHVCFRHFGRAIENSLLDSLAHPAVHTARLRPPTSSPMPPPPPDVLLESDLGAPSFTEVDHALQNALQYIGVAPEWDPEAAILRVILFGLMGALLAGYLLMLCLCPRGISEWIDESTLTAEEAERLRKERAERAMSRIVGSKKAESSADYYARTSHKIPRSSPKPVENARLDSKAERQAERARLLAERVVRSHQYTPPKPPKNVDQKSKWELLSSPQGSRPLSPGRPQYTFAPSIEVSRLGSPRSPYWPSPRAQKLEMEHAAQQKLAQEKLTKLEERIMAAKAAIATLDAEIMRTSRPVLEIIVDKPVNATLQDDKLLVDVPRPQTAHGDFESGVIVATKLDDDHDDERADGGCWRWCDCVREPGSQRREHHYYLMNGHLTSPDAKVMNGAGSTAKPVLGHRGMPAGMPVGTPLPDAEVINTIPGSSAAERVRELEEQKGALRAKLDGWYALD